MFDRAASVLLAFGLMWLAVGRAIPAQTRAGAMASAGSAPQVSQTEMSGRLLQRVDPALHVGSMCAHVSGTVMVRTIVGADGHVRSVHTVSGPGMLQAAARKAVRQWVFSPYLLNGKAVAVQTVFAVKFDFHDDPSCTQA